MAEDKGEELHSNLRHAEHELGKVMGRPGRSNSELERARQGVHKAEHELRKHSDGRAYSHEPVAK